MNSWIRTLWPLGALVLVLSTGCATSQLQRDVSVMRDELDSLRADYKRQSRDVEYLTARVLTLSAKQNEAPPPAAIASSAWETPPRPAASQSVVTNRASKRAPQPDAPKRVNDEPDEPELPPIVLTMADLDRRDADRLPIERIPAAPDFGLSAVSIPETAEAQRDFRTALDYYADGKLVEAISAFRSYLTRHAKSAKRFDVYFWLGETLLELNQLDEAILSFQQVVQHPKSSTRVPDALYKIGLCHRRLGREERAQELFRRVVEDHAASAVSSLARTQLTRGEL